MTDNILQTILIALLASAPALIMAVWAWAKAHAAGTEATWDDEAIAFVEKIAQGVVDSKSAK